MSARFDAVKARPFRVWDLLIYGAVLALFVVTVILAVGRMKAPLTVIEIYVDGALYRTVDVATDTELEIEGRLTVTVRDGVVTVHDAHCHDKLCESMRVASAGQQIVCLPQNVVIMSRDGLGSGEIEVGA